jgi:hypothetical protein
MSTSLADFTAGMSKIGHTSAVPAVPRSRALVLLAGSVRPSNLSRSIGRSLLDLPVEEELSVLQLWEAEAGRVARAAETPELPVRVVLDRSSSKPTRHESSEAIRLSLEQEQHEYRGTGGVLRDVALPYEADDLLLVASAGQILVEPLLNLAVELLTDCADVSLLGHDDGTPGGVFALRCGVLSEVRDIGFLDFKEQVLPRLAGLGQSVRVVRRATATGYPVRTLDSYLAGLRAYHRLKSGRSVSADAFAEDWRPTFSVVEKNSRVDSQATIHDSVVLDGGVVERGAVVVRSIVCPGGVVRANQTVAGQIVAPDRGRKSR